MNDKTYAKKVVVKNEDSTPDARARRLRYLRRLANLSRRQMCDDTINFNTLKGWELARYGGLPRDGACKVINRVAQEGISCELDWLLHGEGQGPVVVKAANSGQNRESQHDRTVEYNRINKELQPFIDHHNDALTHEINDDGMAPVFEPGDWVAGPLQLSDELSKLHNRPCIILLDTGDKLVRKLTVTENQGIVLTCVNEATTVTNPVLFNVSYVLLAPVVWHRKDLACFS